MALARQLLPVLGTTMTVLGFSATTATATVNLLMSIIGPLFIVGSAVWSFVSNSKSSILTSAAQMPEVQSIKLEPSAPADIVQATPTNVTK